MKSKQQIVAVVQTRKSKTILSAVLGIAVLILIVVIVVKIRNRQTLSQQIQDNAELITGVKNPAQVVEHHTSIDQLIGINEIQTLRYDYQAICRVYNDTDKTKPVYYIAYEAVVTLGINGDKIQSQYDDSKKVITIKLPPVEIQAMSVNAGTIDYLFVDTSYNNMETSINAQSRCEKDLESRVSNDEKMFEYARNNTIAEIRAITEPIVEQFYPEYSLEIMWKEG